MRKFLDDDSGQLILIACVSIAVALVLIATYGYYTIGTGEDSINREDMNSFYYYHSIRDNYMNISHNDQNAIIVFENDMKAYALLHGYSVDFVCKDKNTTIIFMDRDIQINEDMGVSC
jgi:hypothetical protein